MRFFVFISIFVAATLALPSDHLSFTKQPFVDTCTGIEVRDGWLVGSCLSGNANERIESSVYLAGYLLPPNYDESFRWAAQKRDGENWYHDRCRTCTIIGDLATCLCEVTWDGPLPYNVSLGEHIFNYAGHLIPDLFGEPTTIPVDTNFPAPHATWSTEPGERDGFTWWLDLSRSHKCRGDRLSVDGYQMAHDTPKECTPVTNITALLLFSDNRDTTAYYRVSVYGEKDCKESSLLKVVEDFETPCSDFGSPVGAFKVEAKWNWV